jgi:hypothetical protein
MTIPKMMKSTTTPSLRHEDQNYKKKQEAVRNRSKEGTKGKQRKAHLFFGITERTENR